jgi:hypothetical protein
LSFYDKCLNLYIKYITMRLQNLLIYHVAKTALFIGAFLTTLITLIYTIELFVGRTISFGSFDWITSKTKDGFYAGQSFSDRLVFLLPGIIMGLTVAYVCWQLGKMLLSIQRNKQFHEPNYKRLFNSGVAIIISNLLLLIIGMMDNNAGKLIIDSTTQGKTVLDDKLGFSWSWVAVGCIFMILAKVFQRGTELQKDHDLNV